MRKLVPVLFLLLFLHPETAKLPRIMAEMQQGKRKRFLFVMVDGLGDVGIPALNNRTPLQHAVTPAMDALATAGRNGLMDPVEVGLACGSDTAHLSILGYPPRTYVV
jgi:2,3-bisphosphoglycerate-independent phosphoglycerate mutase